MTSSLDSEKEKQSAQNALTIYYCGTSLFQLLKKFYTVKNSQEYRLYIEFSHTYLFRTVEYSLCLSPKSLGIGNCSLDLYPNLEGITSRLLPPFL